MRYRMGSAWMMFAALVIVASTAIAAETKTAPKAPRPSAPAVAPAPAAPSPAAASKAPAKPAVKAPTTNEPIEVTLDELKTIMARSEAPRVRITNKFGGKVVGKAVSFEGDKLRVDVSAEGVGVSGISGVSLPSISKIEVLAPLTEEQREEAARASTEYIARLSGRVQAEEFASSESALEAGSTASALAAGSTASQLAPATGETAKKPGETEEETDLLKKYPPGEGWGPKKLGEIIRKAVVLHLEPFGKEKTFIKDYDAWRTAYDQKRAQQLEEVEALKGMGKPVPADLKVLPELESVPSIEGAPSPGPEAPVGNSSNEAPVGAPSGEPSGSTR